MGQIGQYGLQDPKTAIRMAQPHRLLVTLPGLFVVLLLVVDDPQLGIDQGISRTDLLGLHQRQSSSLEVISPEIFHPHVEVSLRTPRKQSHNGPVDGHGLVRFVLNSKRMRHSYPCKQEALVQYDRLLEIFTSHLVLFAVEVVSANSEPTHGMRGIVLDQVVGAVVELTGEVQVEQAGRIDRQDVETQRVLLDGLQAELVGCWNLVVLVQGASPNTQDIDVFSNHQRFEDVVSPHFLLGLLRLHVLHSLNLGRKDLSQPLVLTIEGQALNQLLLLNGSDQLAVDQSAEPLDIGRVLHHGLRVQLDCSVFILLGLVALCSNACLEAVHFAIDVAVFQLQLEDSQALIVLFIRKQSPSGQQLETDVPVQQFVALEESVYFLVISVPEGALPQEIDCSDVFGREGNQFVCKKDSVCVGVDVEVVDGEVVESAEDLVGEHLGGECVQFWKVVFGVAAVVGLQQFCQEEEAVGLGGGEDRWFFGLPAHTI